MEKLKIVIVGHVDHGKSSLIGRLLYDTKSISEDKLTEVKANCKSGHLDFAYFLDHLQEEREQKITIESTQTFFKTLKREYVIIDAPGHVEFVRNMITGASKADTAVLIVDVEEGCQEQTRRHAFILSMLGFHNIILLINKMDVVDYQQERFEETVKECVQFLSRTRINVLHCIPISAIFGDNVAFASQTMTWYKGKTVLQALDQLTLGEKDKKELCYPVQDVYYVNDQRMAVGMIESGVMKVGDEVMIMPDMHKASIRTIEKYKESLTEAHTKESVGITTDAPVYLEKGNILTHTDSRLLPEKKYKANVFWIAKDPLTIETKLQLQCVTQSTLCKVTSIFNKINTSTLEAITNDDECIRSLEMCEVEIQTKKLLVMCSVEEIESLGRFVLICNNNICGYGIIS